tara:strand:+ start:635 stop:991 length:357 start_codon:yes stop_codon:yes gene_type:complete
MTTRSAAREKSRAFALRVVKSSRFLQSERKEYVLSKQLLRSGTAIGALIREAEYAESRADFIHKLHIALKEASETDYWIDLLCDSGYFNSEAGASLQADAEELIRLLTAIIKTTKTRS